jgi:ornithine cyclodeaminase
MRVLTLSHRDVLAALSPEDCAEAMAAVLAEHARGGTYLPLRSVMVPPGAAGFLGLMPGWRAGDQNGAAAFALKAVCIMPGNPARGLDAHQGLVTLFDGQTGVPTAILDASAVTAVRTAAVTAVATRLLARGDARCSRSSAPDAGARPSSGARLRDFAQVRVYARPGARPGAGPGGRRGTRGARRRGERGGSGPRRRRRRDGDQRTEPVLRHGWLKPGAHVNAVGASIRRRASSTPPPSPRARVLRQPRVGATIAAEFRLAIAEGLIAGEGHVRAELGEVLAGTAPGRRIPQADAVPLARPRHPGPRRGRTAVATARNVASAPRWNFCD